MFESNLEMRSVSYHEQYCERGLSELEKHPFERCAHVLEYFLEKML